MILDGLIGITSATVSTRMMKGNIPMPTWTKWHVSAMLTVWFSVLVTIMLMSISAGVERVVNRKLGEMDHAGGNVNIGQINDILHWLTGVIAVALGIQACFTTTIIAIAVMVIRQQKMGQDVKSGFKKMTLTAESVLDMLIPIAGGATAGWASGVLASEILTISSPLVLRFMYTLHFVVWSTTTLVTMLVVGITAYHFSGKSPKSSGAS